jgi:hypothetical protein
MMYEDLIFHQITPCPPSGIMDNAECGQYEQRQEEVIMKRLELSKEEALTLVEVLESALSDLVAETVATENREMRAALKEKKTFIREILVRLGTGEEKPGS